MKKLTQNINKDKFFNDLPQVKIDNSKWITRHTNYQACNLGEIVPIYYDEVLPNEEREVKMAMTSHTTTPVAPIFNSMYTELRSFVIPIRLCADLLQGYTQRKSPWVKVFGEDPSKSSSNVIVPLAQQTLPTIPSSMNTNKVLDDIVGYYANAPTDNVFDSLDLIAVTDKDGLAKMNWLNLAAYELTYQRHYRNENYEATTDSPLFRLLCGAYGYSHPTVSFPSTFTFHKANREKDYFTGMKPFTQKGDSVKLSLAGTAPVGAVTENSGDQFADEAVSATKLGTEEEVSFEADSKTLHFFADMTRVTGISIEELRLLVKTQELLEKDAMYGSRYAESLNAHFGCAPLDLTLQDPQEIYRTTISSHMQAIFQTSSTNGESTILGTIGANSTTQTEPFVIMPRTRFKEHCIVMICAVHKLQNVYDTKYFKPKFLFKKARFDFYTPELNDLGYQPVSSDEFRTSTSPVAGYNEAFSEYRYKFNKVHGSLGSQFPYWAPAISNEYASASALYKEDTAILDKALSVLSTSAPQFYDAWGFEEVNSKPMSLHSIPGMDGVI